MQKKSLSGLQAVPVYAVALNGRDAAGALHGPLANARRDFFEKNRTVRVAVSDSTQGFDVKYNGKITRGALRWRERAATGAYCRTFTLRGEDMLLFYDAYGKLSRRIVYRENAWLRSDYFDPADSARAAEMLVADPERDAMVRYTRKEGEEGYTTAVLLPLAMPADAALQSYVNSKLGEPAVLALLPRGEFMYCTAEEKEQREALYAAGLPGDEPEQEPEAVFPFEVWNGEVNVPAPEEPEENEPEEVPAEEEEMLPDEEPAAEDPEEEAPVEETAESAEELPAEEAEMPAEEIPAEEPVELAAEEPAVPEENGLVAAPAEADLTFSRGENAYRYVGETEEGKRHGRGRTEQENGLTAYDGEYADDKKEGFGSLYYKNGGLCYAGNWKNNRRHGLGASFRKEDNSLHVGRWENGIRVGMDFLFDSEGRLCVIRDSGDGEGKTVFCIDNSGTVITGLPDAPGNGRGSEFDDDGNIVYTGMHKDGLRHGEGTSFRADGQIEFTGQWENGVFVEGIAFGPNGAGKYKAIL